MSELTERTERVRARTRSAAEDLARAEADLAQTVEISVVAGLIGHFATQVRSGIDRLDWYQRRHVIRTLVTRVEIDEGGATVVFRVPPAPSGGGAQPGDEAIDAPRHNQELFCQMRARGAGHASPAKAPAEARLVRISTAPR